MKINIAIALLLAVLSLISYGDNENNENIDVHFYPVKEIIVDELPESIMDLEFVHSTSKLPVVFRGAAKHWEAMKWTPESLEERGIGEIKRVFEDSSRRKFFRQFVYYSEKEGRRTEILKNEDRLSFMFEDISYLENKFKDIIDVLHHTHFNWMDHEVYRYDILVGSEGFEVGFHSHTTAVLAEFYGEKMIFLAEPSEDYRSSEDFWKYTFEKIDHESNKIIKDWYNNSGDVFSDNNNNYAPFQQVILKPGDVLYIPSGWYHKVYYLSPCIGSTQFIETNLMNVFYHIT